jgi:hypothetical protein
MTASDPDEIPPVTFQDFAHLLSGNPYSKLDLFFHSLLQRGFATYFVAASLRLADFLDFHCKTEVCRQKKSELRSKAVRAGLRESISIKHGSTSTYSRKMLARLRAGIVILYQAHISKQNAAKPIFLIARSRQRSLLE